MTGTVLAEIKSQASSDDGTSLLIELRSGSIRFDHAALMGLRTGTLTIVPSPTLSKQESLSTDGTDVYAVSFTRNSTFDGKITVTLPYTANENTEEHGVWAYSLTNGKVSSSQIVKDVDGSAVFSISKFTTIAVGYIPALENSGDETDHAVEWFIACLISADALAAAFIILRVRRNKDDV